MGEGDRSSLGPTRATIAEKTLAERGEREAIEHIRRRFQQQMADKFTDVVEQATGRKVRVFLSEANIHHDVSVEMFLLADDPIGQPCESEDAERLD